MRTVCLRKRLGGARRLPLSSLSHVSARHSHATISLPHSRLRPDMGSRWEYTSRRADTKCPGSRLSLGPDPGHSSLTPVPRGVLGSAKRVRTTGPSNFHRLTSREARLRRGKSRKSASPAVFKTAAFVRSAIPPSGSECYRTVCPTSSSSIPPRISMINGCLGKGNLSQSRRVTNFLFVNFSVMGTAFRPNAISFKLDLLRLHRPKTSISHRNPGSLDSDPGCQGGLTY